MNTCNSQNRVSIAVRFVLPPAGFAQPIPHPVGRASLQRAANRRTGHRRFAAVMVCTKIDPAFWFDRVAGSVHAFTLPDA